MLIDPLLQSQFTWTGKCSTHGSNKNTNQAMKAKKYPFSIYKEFHELLFDLLHMADKKYTFEDLKHDLVYKIFKYAYLNE